MNTRWQVHISVSLLLSFFLVTGRFAEYVILVLSLFIHELGHIAAARLVGVQIQSVCFYMHGAAIHFRLGWISPKQQAAIACGGPLATLLILLLCLGDRQVIFTQVLEIQQLLLIINLCPIWPLDGGRIIQAILLGYGKTLNGEWVFLKISFCASIVGVLVAIVLFKPFFILLFSVICKQIIDEIKQFPLRKAYKQLVMSGK